MMRISLMIAATFLVGQTAFAHAFLERASPAVGSEVAASPPALGLRYTEPVEPLFSSVHVSNNRGERVDTNNLATEDDGRVLVIGLKPLLPGTYTVEWHVTSVDTHKTEGRFSFTVQR